MEDNKIKRDPIKTSFHGGGSISKKLSPLYYLKLLCPELPMLKRTSDTAQSIYPHSWMVKGRNFTSIRLDMMGKSSQLSKNYRTTTQIAECATAFWMGIQTL